jgi:hypothetical protein
MATSPAEKEDPVKRRYTMVLLAVVLALVLAGVLAGPANAGTGKWQPFTATFLSDPSEWVPATMWPEWKGDHDGDFYPDFAPVRSINERYAGPYVSSVPALSGYMVVHTSGIWTYSKEGVLRVKYTNKSTLYVGAASASEGTGGRWEMTASGLYVSNGVTESHTLTGRGHGVSGDVKGWVMRFFQDFPGGAASGMGSYLEK